MPKVTIVNEKDEVIGTTSKYATMPVKTINGMKKTSLYLDISLIKKLALSKLILAESMIS